MVERTLIEPCLRNTNHFAETLCRMEVKEIPPESVTRDEYESWKAGCIPRNATFEQCRPFIAAVKTDLQREQCALDLMTGRGYWNTISNDKKQLPVFGFDDLPCVGYHDCCGVKAAPANRDCLAKWERQYRACSGASLRGPR
jgi:hypothetical protein